MPALSLAGLPAHTVRQSVVEVPEFGTDDEGRPFTVNVRAMTVLTANILSSKSLTLKLGEDGELSKNLSDTFDRASLVAAMHTYDDEGDLTFGKTVDEAIRYVENLPNIYRTAVYRISHEAYTLSDIEGATEQDAIKAEKKS